MFFSKDLVSSHYLKLLNDVECGIPLKLVCIANSIENLKDLENLLARLNKPLVLKIRSKFIINSSNCDMIWRMSRDQVLQIADQAKIEKKFRLAVKYYGSLILLSEHIDDALKWSIFHLRDISDIHYKISAPNTNANFLNLVKG